MLTASLIMLYAVCGVRCDARALPTRRLALDTPQVQGRWDGVGPVTSLAATADGFLWLATARGLTRFDGTRFRDLGPDDAPAFNGAEATALHVNRRGELWVALAGKTRLLRRRLDSIPPKFEEAAVLPTTVTAIAEGGNGGLWLGTTHGLLERKASGQIGPAKHGPTSQVTALLVDGADRLWVGAEEGLWLVDRDRAELLPDTPSVRGLALAPDGQVWVAARRKVLRVEFRQGAPAVAVERGYVGTALAASPEGALWVGREMGGIFRVQPPADDLGFVAADGIPDLSIVALTMDANGGLWGATRTGSLFTIRPRRVANLGQREGMPGGPSFALAEAKDGSLWMSLVGGVVRLPGSEIERLNRSEGPAASHCARGFARANDGGLWLASCDRGLLRLDDSTWTSPGELDIKARNVWPRRSGGLWAANAKGSLFAWQGGSATDGGPQTVPIPGLAPCSPETKANSCPSDILALVEPADDRLWLGTRGLGLIEVRGNQATAHLAAGDGRPSGAILALHPDARGAIWVGTETRGLLRAQEGLLKAPPPHPDLPTAVHGIVEDARGWLWLTSSDGVYRVKRDAVDRFLDHAGEPPAVVHYGARDGMESVRCAREFSPSILLGSDGHVYVPTVGGLSVFSTTEEPQGPAARAYAETLHVDGRRVPLGESVSAYRGRGHLTFSIASPSLHVTTNLRVTVRLAGLSPWQPVPESGLVTFEDVPAGKVLLETAAKRPLDHAPTITRMELELLPLYRTGWFQASFLATAGLFTGAAFILRNRRLRLRAEAVLAERRRLAQDLHDSLAVSFTGIGYQLEILQQMLEDGEPDRARRLLDETRAMVRHSRQQARRSVWDIRTQALEMRTLAQALDATAAEARRVGTANVSVTVEGTPPTLPRRSSEALLYVAQEAIVNAIAHGHASEVQVQLRSDGRLVRLEVSDDGSGIDASELEAGLHFGLVGMRERAEALGGRLEVESHLGQGTRIAIELPCTRRSSIWDRLRWRSRKDGSP